MVEDAYLDSEGAPGLVAGRKCAQGGKCGSSGKDVRIDNWGLINLGTFVKMEE